jgi:hypothetical protein
MHITFTWNQVFFIFAFFIALVSLMIGVAVAQEVYRPMLMKSDKITDAGLFCVTSEEIATGAKLLGVNWIAVSGISMTLFEPGKKLGESIAVEIEFAHDGCATSAKVDR